MIVAITGAARGIGYATAKALKAGGATVVIGDIDEEAVAKAASELGVEGHVLDVTNRASFEVFLEAAGEYDVLINNAGIMPIGPVLEETDADAKRCFDINVHGVMLGTKIALARFVPLGKGHVINIASLAGVLSTPGLALYNGSKAAVLGFTEAARLEVKRHGVEVSAVLPTFTNTELVAGTRSPKGQKNCEPEDIAKAVVNLIAKPRPQVTVPSKLAASVKISGLMPQSVKDAMNRRLGLDTIFLDFDHDARKAYDSRIRS
ncbi:SDR family oxidoreductase [Actinocorallia longicatena]|uniref:SDR family oxidoreductase n=1 Tax=Actinocorallia longicatena TaxID=111803 RepID=A0ABP6Q189_9ACTN